MGENTITDEVYKQYMALHNECRDISNKFMAIDRPLGLELYYPHNCPYSESDWNEVIVSVKKTLPGDAEWDDWKLIEDRQVCSRLFGSGHKSELLKDFLDVVTQARVLMCRYADLYPYIPESLQWGVHPSIPCGNETSFFWEDDHEPLSLLGILNYFENYRIADIVVGNDTLSVYRHDNICQSSSKTMELLLPTLQPQVVQDNTPDGPPFIFRLKKRVWEVRYTCGTEREEDDFDDSVNFELVAKLLRNPGKEISVDDLARSTEDASQASEALERYKENLVDFSERNAMQQSFRPQQVIDSETQADIKKSIESLDLRIHKAKAKGGLDGLAEAEEYARQKGIMSAFLSDATSKTEQLRNFPSKAPSKKARNRVKTGYSRFLATVEHVMPQFHKHLKASIYKKEDSNIWWYAPAEPITWVT